MPFFVSHTPKDYAPAPEGLHQAVCVDLIDLGMVTGAHGEKHKLLLVWQIDESDPTNEGRRFQVVKRYTVSLHEKATLRKELETWRGRKFTPEELKQFDLEKLIGANCQVQVQHNIADDGRTFANVQAIVPMGKSMVALRPEGYVRKKDRDAMKAETGGATGSAGQPGGKGGAYDDDVPF